MRVRDLAAGGRMLAARGSIRAYTIPFMSTSVKSSECSVNLIGLLHPLSDFIARWFLQKLTKDLAQANQRNRRLAVRWPNNVFGTADDSPSLLPTIMCAGRERSS